MRLSSAEYEIMQVIWGKEGPASGSDLEPLSRRRGWIPRAGRTCCA